MPYALDRAEFGRLFAEHARLLWVVAAASVPAGAVEDVLQDAAAVALSRLDDFAPNTSFRAWMTQIVRFTAANAKRRQRRAAVEPLVGEPAGLPEPGPLVAGNGTLHEVQAEFDDHVLHALHDLPEDARTSLLLRVIMDLSYAEIAAMLDLPEGTVASHVHRARALLRERLGNMPAAADRPRLGSARAGTAGGRP